MTPPIRLHPRGQVGSVALAWRGGEDVTFTADDEEPMNIDKDQVLWSAPEGERTGRPLLILLHGHRMSEQVGFELRHRLPPELVIASLRGPHPVRGGGYAWFPLDDSLSPATVDRSAQSVLTWLDGLHWPTPVGVLGFSQGVATAFQMVRHAPERFAYAVNLSGSVVPLPTPADQALARRRLPVFWGRGDRDPVIPAPLVTATGWWLRTNTDLTERVYPGLGHNVTDGELDDLHAFLTRQLSRGSAA